MTVIRDLTKSASCVGARISSASWLAGQDSSCLAAVGLRMGIDMLELKALIGLGLIVGLGGIALIIYKLQQLIRAIVDLHSDISVIRLDNSRTMAEIRRRYR